MGSIFKGGVEYPAGTSKAIDQSYDNTNSGIAAVTTQGAIDEISSNLGNINVYVGEEDKKLHFVNSEGADSVLPFKSGINFDNTMGQAIFTDNGHLIQLEPNSFYFIYYYSTATLTSGYKNIYTIVSPNHDTERAYVIETDDTGRIYGNSFGYAVVSWYKLN